MEKEINLEDSLKRLDEIAKSLESGKTTLDESLKLYKEGINLSKLCMDKLENAKGKVMEIKKQDGTEEKFNG